MVLQGIFKETAMAKYRNVEEGEEWNKLYENLEQLSGEHHNQPLVFQHTAFQDAESVLNL